MTATIKAGTTLTSRSICDHNCIFSIQVLSRTAKTATIIDTRGEQKRTKIHVFNGAEFVQPDSYSMAPVFRAV